MKILLENIKELVQVVNEPLLFRAGAEMATVSTIKNAFLIIRDEVIDEFGRMDQLKDKYLDDDLLVEIDCSNRLVYPSYCDPHTHLVFPHSCEADFVKRISRPNDTQNSETVLAVSKQLLEMSEEELYLVSLERIVEIMKQGTGAVEIKSGYGLEPESELKMLRVARLLKDTAPICVRSTFFGAHAVPEDFRNKESEYVDLVINEMIPQVAADDLADYIDVFSNSFSPYDVDRIVLAGMKYGMRPKLHANYYAASGGVQVALKYNALSVDHLNFISGEEIGLLKNSDTMPTILPGSDFFRNSKLPPVRKMIDAGLPIALASDFNPNTAPSGSMNFVSSLGCINYHMSPQEVINATTLNSAYAMGVADSMGSITRGKIANLFITGEVAGIESLPFHFGSNLIETVILNGEVQSF